MRDHPVMAAHAATGLLYLQPLIAEDKSSSEAASSEPEFHVDVNVCASNESGIVIPASSPPQDSVPENHIPLKDVEHLSSGMS